VFGAKNRPLVWISYIDLMAISAGRAHFALQVRSADMDIKAMFQDPYEGCLVRFVDSMGQIGMNKAFKRLEIRLEARNVGLKWFDILKLY
jgi:hypothetical protein